MLNLWPFCVTTIGLGVLGVLAQYFNLLLSCEVTKKTSRSCASNYFSKFFLNLKHLLAENIFVLITILHGPLLNININFSLIQKNTQ